MYLAQPYKLFPSMSQLLLYGDFKWVPVDENTIQFILNLNNDSSYGFILEMNLKYPREVHNLHNDYPLAAENIEIKVEDLSPFVKTY